MGSPLEVLANYNPTGFALANQQRQAQLAQTQAQTAGIPAQTQAVQLENQLRIRQLRDTDAVTRAWGGVDRNADPALQQQQLEQGIIQNGGSVNAVLGIRGSLADFRIKNATATKDEQANQQTIHEGDAGTIDSIVKGPEADKPQAWRDFLPTLQSHHPNLQLPPEYPGDPAATSIGNRSRLLGAIAETNLKGAQAGEATAKGQQATAEAAKATGEATLLQKQLDAMTAAAQAPGATRYGFIDSEIDPAKSPGHAALNRAARATYDSMLGAGAKVEDAVKAVAPFANQAAILSREADPNVLEARRKNEILTRVGTQAAIAATGGTAFSGILDSTARAQAEADYKKTSEDYATKVGAARQVQDFVQAAQSGNKAAPGLIPISIVRELVNRVNRQELQSVSGAAGSAWDRLQGVWYGLKDGDPIPPAVLKDIGTISGVMEKAADRTYKDNVAINRQTYHSAAQPITLPSATETRTPAATPAATAGRIYTDADVTAAMRENRNLSRTQIEKRFTDEGFVKQ